MNEWMVVLRFAVSADEQVSFRSEAERVVRLLAAQEGCQDARLGRAADDPSVWAVVLQWSSVGAYRRALSGYDVKVDAVPFLSRAIDEPSAFETLFAVDADGEHAASGDLASAADPVDRDR